MAASDIVVGGRYRLTKKIGSGSFGQIWLAQDVETAVNVAVKIESRRARHPQLQIESKVFRILRSETFGGVPRLFWFGQNEEHNILVMELLGKNLQEHLDSVGGKFSLATTVRLAIQALRLMRYMHSRGLMHRDLKPENFLMGPTDGRGRQKRLFIIDFGLAKQFMHPRTKMHIPPRTGKSLTGTPRYASLNNHAGHEQSRRDDLESLGYILVYFLKGQLPWQGLRARTREEKYAKIRGKKESLALPSLCVGLPREFADFIAYARKLPFDHEPDYDRLEQLFASVAMREGIDLRVSDFDWEHSPAAPSAMQRSPSQAERSYGGMRSARATPGLSAASHSRQASGAPAGGRYPLSARQAGSGHSGYAPPPRFVTAEAYAARGGGAGGPVGIGGGHRYHQSPAPARSATGQPDRYQYNARMAGGLASGGRAVLGAQGGYSGRRPPHY